MDAVMRPDAPMRLESGDYKFDELLTHPEKLLTFITSDGKHIDVPVGSIRHSVTLYNCLQGTDVTVEENGKILLPGLLSNVHSHEFGRVVTFLTRRNEKGELFYPGGALVPKNVPIPKKKDTDEQQYKEVDVVKESLDDWETDFFRIPLHELKALILAVNFLDLDFFLQLACKALAIDYLKGYKAVFEADEKLKAALAALEKKLEKSTEESVESRLAKSRGTVNDSDGQKQKIVVNLTHLEAIFNGLDDETQKSVREKIEDEFNKLTYNA